MKKNLIAILIIALVSVGLFAAVSDAQFQVQTTISAINDMKLTTSSIDALSPMPTSLSGVTGFTAPVKITSSGATEAFTAYISALSNNQAGFTVKMSATPMVSTSDPSNGNNHKINYTVAAGGVEYITGTTANPVTVISQGTITALKGVSKVLSISVDTVSFNAAIQDSYEGTVTFTYTSNT